VGKHLTDAALKSFSLIPDSGVRLTTDIDDFIECALSNFFGRGATPFGRHDHHTADIAACECAKHRLPYPQIINRSSEALHIILEMPKS
jgi:hypothetical protein